MDVVKATKGLTALVPEMDCDQTIIGCQICSISQTDILVKCGVSEEYLRCLYYAFGHKA
jgi:hypothetical protein